MISIEQLIALVEHAGGFIRLTDSGQLSCRAPAELRPQIVAQRAAIVAYLSEVIEVDFDIETRSACDLKKEGAFTYACHATSDLLCASLRRRDTGQRHDWIPGTAVPGIAFHPKVLWHCHGPFEWILSNVGQAMRRHGWPAIPLERYRCSMAQAQLRALPGALGKVCDALGIDGKDVAAGEKLIPFFCAPNNAKAMAKGAPAIFNRPEDHPEKFAEFRAYNGRDTDAEGVVSVRLPPLSALELRVWEADARVNHRGMGIDRELAANARKVVLAFTAEKNAELLELTGGEVERASQLVRLKAWLSAQQPSLPVKCLDQDATADLLDRNDLLPAVRQALEIKADVVQAAPKKLDKMLAWSASDGRAHWTLMYCGAARTRRWSGKGYQPQNLKRPTLLTETDDIAAAIAAVGTGDLEEVKKRFEHPIEAIGDLSRSIICAAPRRLLMGGDFSSIEARMLAGLAGDTDKLQVFRDHDDDPEHCPEIYVLNAARVFAVAVGAVTKAQRQTGKTMELAFGYGGGLGSFRNFHGRKSKLIYSDDEVEEFKETWRDANFPILQFWYWVQEAAINALVSTWEVSSSKYPVRFRFDRAEDCLFVRLPSGGELVYPRPRAKNGEFEFTEYGRKVPSKMYGGRWAAHITQACARDLLAEALVRVDAAGFEVVLHAHDEIICDIDEGADLAAERERFRTLMTELPAWAEALHLPVVLGKEPWVGLRYRKD
jgi:DNA polymerase